MKRLLLPLLAALALPTAVNSEISNEFHKKCLEARDYAGCVKTNIEKSYLKKINLKKSHEKEYKKLSFKEKYYIEINKAEKRCEKFKEISYSQFIEKLDKNLIKGYLYFGGYTKKDKYTGEILEPNEIKSNLVQINTLRGNEKLDKSSQVNCIEYMQATYPSVTTDRCNSFVFIVYYLFF